jgi:hypothetical protein
MAANRTVPTDADVTAFLDAVPDPVRRADAGELCDLMQEVAGEAPRMWGGSIVGFGTYHYRYASGREGDTPAIGFAARKRALVLYGVLEYEERTELLDDLGPHERGKGCLYVKRLADVDRDVLRRMLGEAYAARRTAP